MLRGVRQTNWSLDHGPACLYLLLAFMKTKKKFQLKINYRMNSPDASLVAEILRAWVQVQYDKPEIVQV